MTFRLVFGFYRTKKFANRLISYAKCLKCSTKSTDLSSCVDAKSLKSLAQQQLIRFTKSNDRIAHYHTQSIGTEISTTTSLMPTDEYNESNM